MRGLLIIIASFILLVCSCTTTKVVEVPVETVRTEYINQERHDSVFIKDSVDRYIKGDTIYLTKTKYIYKYTGSTDTLVRIDTIPKLITVEKIKPVKEV